MILYFCLLNTVVLKPPRSEKSDQGQRRRRCRLSHFLRVPFPAGEGRGGEEAKGRGLSSATSDFRMLTFDERDDKSCRH
ncbi:uncharacterized [Tachysurus ichikawai]